MAIRISSTAPVSGGRAIAQAQSQVENSLRAISSGSRVSRPADDAAAFAIADSLRSQIGSSDQAQMNADAAQGLLQTAEGGLNEQSNILIRLRELAVNSASDTVSEDQRGYLNEEFQQLTAEFDRIAKSTSYGGRKLLNETNQEYEFQVGANEGADNVITFKSKGTSSSEAGISGLEIDGKGAARGALDDIDQALNRVAESRANFGSAQSRLQYASDGLGAQVENLSAARSRIADVDVAAESAKLASAQIQTQAAVAVAAQTNQSSALALRLLQ